MSLTKICQTVISLTFSLMSQFHTDSVVFVAISFYPAVRTGSSNTPFFFFYPAVRTGSSNTPFFFFFFLSWSVAPDLRSVKTILAGKLCSFSVYSPEFS